jgi:hypothetical protein
MSSNRWFIRKLLEKELAKNEAQKTSGGPTNDPKVQEMEAELAKKTKDFQELKASMKELKSSSKTQIEVLANSA